MKIIKNFNLIDIKRYEDETSNNILSFFDDIRFSNIIELVRLGNGNCSEEKASELLDDYLSTDKTLLDAVLEIKESLLGIGDNDDNDVADSDKMDITKYNSLTDLYIEYSMQLMSVGLQYNEFWNMNTKEMYRVFNSIVIKLQNETNRELSNFHTLAAMVGGAVWGKLDKEPPRVNMVSQREANANGLDVDDMIMIAKLKSLVDSHNKEVMEKGE